MPTERRLGYYEGWGGLSVKFVGVGVGTPLEGWKIQFYSMEMFSVVCKYSGNRTVEEVQFFQWDSGKRENAVN